MRNLIKDESELLATSNTRRKHELWTDECESAAIEPRMKWQDRKKEEDLSNFETAKRTAAEKECQEKQVEREADRSDC